MLRGASSSLLCGRARWQQWHQCRQLRHAAATNIDATGGSAPRRSLSFKSLASRNADKNRANHPSDRDNRQRRGEQHRSRPTRKAEGGFSAVVRGNKAAAASSEDAAGRRIGGYDDRTTHRPPWRQGRQRDAPAPPSSLGSSFGDGSNAHTHAQRVSSHVNNRQRPTARPGGDGDLRDISQLRNTFMKIPDRPHRREPWRGNDVTSRTPRPHSPSYNSRPSFSLSDNSPGNAHSRVDGVGVDATAAAAGVGARWTPTYYKKRPPPPPPGPSPLGIGGVNVNSPGSGGDGGAQSLEQVMKANALQRREDMERRYQRAGEQVPYNADAHGNPNGAGRFGWRDRGRGSRGRGGNAAHRNWRGRDPKWGGGLRPRPAAPGRHRQKAKRHLPPSTPKSVRLPSGPLTLRDLAGLLRVRKRTIVRTLRSLGEQVAYSDARQDSYTIDVEMVEFICVELGIEPTKAEKRESDVEEAERRAMRASRDEMDEEARTEEEERHAALPPRSPVVSIMGHVDHGKTTLMDALRRRAVTGENTPKGAGKPTKGKKGKKKKKEKKGRGKGGVSVDDEDVAGTEAGGITQTVTAFEVPLEEGGSVADNGTGISTVTFLDTPGHAAFRKMRQSGSSATDVIVLVVAADDGVSPQTVEIIDMYKSIAQSQPGSISLVVAVTKVDKHGIDVDEAVARIENQLIEHDIFTENVLAGGGDEGEFGACQLFPVSGLTGEGLDDLVEGLALQSEIMDLRADDEARGEGIVIDARMERGLGVVADCVIRWGSVTKGDYVVSGTNGGRVRHLNDVGNRPLERARPSQPVRIVGFKSPPRAGDPIVCAASEDDAKELVRLRESELVNEERAQYEGAGVELQVTGTAAKQGLMMQKAQEHYGFGESVNGGEEGEGGKASGSIYIPVVIKADSHGALDAVRDALVGIGDESALNIVIDPVEMSTGVVTTSDVIMARESDAAIFAFGKVGVADRETKNLAEESEVPIRTHDIIYRLLEDAKEYFERYLPVEDVERVHGRANVQAVFGVTDTKTKKSVNIAGLRVTEGNLYKEKCDGDDGEVQSSCYYRVLRKGKVITDAADAGGKNKKKKLGITASSLRKVKEDVNSVRRGEECGLGLDGFNDLEEGDVVECYSIEEERASI